LGVGVVFGSDLGIQNGQSQLRGIAKKRKQSQVNKTSTLDSGGNISIKTKCKGENKMKKRCCCGAMIPESAKLCPFCKHRDIKIPTRYSELPIWGKVLFGFVLFLVGIIIIPLSGLGKILPEFIIAVPLFLLYFLPSIIAGGVHSGGKKKNYAAIFTLNLLTGWTGIGWLVCLIWAICKD
jgi:hypothetical protein